MTGEGGEVAVDEAAPAAAPEGEPARAGTNAPRSPFWRFGFPALVVLCALAVPAVAWYGKEALLDSRGGKVEAPILDPNAPGYEAVVEPTPTMLVVHLSDADTLVGLTLLAQAGVDGGSVLFIPVNTSVVVDDLGLPDPSTVTVPPSGATEPGEQAELTDPTDPTDPTTGADSTATTVAGAPAVDDTTPVADDTSAPRATTTGPTATGAFPLKDVYQLGGTPAVVRGVEKLLGIGIGGRPVEIGGEVVDEPDADAVVEISNARWQELLAPVAPLTVENDHVVTVTDPETGEVVSQFPTGEVPLPAEGVGAFLEARNEGESELNRLARQQVFWLAWLEVVSQSSDPAVIPGEVDAGLGGFVRGLATSNVSFFNLPVDAVSVPGSGDELYLADEEAVADLIASLVPFPVGSEVSPRPRVRVLDGTGVEGIGLEAAHRLVRAGAEIEIMGNAASFDHVANDVIYYDESMAEVAAGYAEVLGGAAIAHVEEPGEIVDITVVIGTDFDPDAITPPSTAPETTTTGGEGG